MKKWCCRAKENKQAGPFTINSWLGAAHDFKHNKVFLGLWSISIPKGSRLGIVFCTEARTEVRIVACLCAYENMKKKMDRMVYNYVTVT